MGIPSSSGTDLEESFKEDIPDHYLMLIAEAIRNGDLNATGGDMNRPILKSSIRSSYWIFILQYAILAIIGIISNIAIIVYTLYYKLFKDITHAFIINLSLCHVVQCSIVLPISLMVMLIQNWIFGQFLCFFLPMLQDIPLHVAMISHLLIAWDRMRWLGDPLKGRLPTFVCCCASWLTGMVIALPYPIYTLYIELGDYVTRLQGIGLCVVNLMDDMHEYIRGLFVIMYCGPSILLAYLYVRTSQELRPPDGPFAIMMFEHRSELRCRQRNSSTTSGSRPRADSNRSFDLYSAELDVSCEKRYQRVLGSMAATQVLCICPLMIMKMARMIVIETYENSKHFDFTYLMFVWIAFLPTVIFPCIYASQILPGTEKERLRGYFRLSSKRRLNKSQTSQEESSIEQETTTTTAIEIPTINNNNEEEYESGNKSNPKKETVTHKVSGTVLESSQTESTQRQSQLNSIAKTTSHNQLIARDGKVSMAIDKRQSRSGSAKDNNERQQPLSSRPRINSQNNSTTSSLRSSANGSSARVNVKIDKVNSPLTDMSSQQRYDYPPKKSFANDSLNNSNSNITSSTYCNVSGSVSGSAAIQDRHEMQRNHIGPVAALKRGSADFDADSMISGSDTKTSLYGGIYDRKYAGSGVNPVLASLMSRNRDISFDCASHLSYRSQGSSSTLDRDLEIIDLLERERSMDIQDMIERERRGEIVRNYSITSERRRLPDLEKIKCKSPKIVESTLPQQHPLYNSSIDSGCVPTPPISADTTANQFEYPSTPAGYFTNHYHQLLPNSRRPGSRKSSTASSRVQSSIGAGIGGGSKRDSLTSAHGLSTGIGMVSTTPIIANDEDLISSHSSTFQPDNISEVDEDIQCVDRDSNVSVIENFSNNVNRIGDNQTPGTILTSSNKFRERRLRNVASVSPSIRSSSVKSNRLIRNSMNPLARESSAKLGGSQKRYETGVYERRETARTMSESDGQALGSMQKPPLTFEQNIYAQL